MYPSHWAALEPDKTAVILAEDGSTLSYGELDRRSTRLANLFADHAIVPGDHVAVMMSNTLTYFEVVWAALLAGVHVSPISSFATAEDAAYILQDCGARAFVTDDAMGDVVADLPARVPACSLWLMVGGTTTPGFLSYAATVDAARADAVDPERPIGEYMLYSSGTTGRPKGVLRPNTGRTIAQGSIANRFLTRVFDADADSVYLSPAPLYHGAPLGFTIGVTSLGGTAVVMRKFDAAAALTAIDRYAVTHSQWVPTMFNRMLALDEPIRAAYDGRTHRVAIHAAAPCPRHVKEAMFGWWGPILHEYYSGTEDVGVTYASPQDWLAHPGTVGRPLGFRLHVCAEDGAEMPAGGQGRVYFETRTRPFEYHGSPEKTGRSRHPEHDSWVTLDDVGYLDEDGYLFLTDRASFMIISGGVNVYPQEVEDVLLQHPKVADVAVVGLPDDDMGERVLAVVEPARGVAPGPALEDELAAFAQEHLAGPKRPRQWDFVPLLPRLETGKIAKRELRASYAVAAS